MPKAGRSRRFGMPRYPGGQIRHSSCKPVETAEQIKATVMRSRRRHHPDLNPRSSEEEIMAGYELGRLHLRGTIDERQRKAGETWARCVVRFARTMGYPAPTPRSVNLDEGRGLSCAAEVDPVRVRVVRQDYAAAFRMLSEAGITLQERRLAMSACRDVCVQDADTRAWPHHMVDALKRGLDRLADCFGI